MNRIGTTSTGNVIVEMTPLEFEALQRLKGTAPALDAKKSEAHPAAEKMTHAALTAYVGDRLKKLKAKRRDAVVRSVEAMFQFNGGIGLPLVDKVLASLQRQGVLLISPDGNVSYPQA